MVTRAQLHALAMRLPGTVAATDGIAYGVPSKSRAGGFAWSWKERVHPKQPRLPNDRVLAVRTSTVAARDAMIAHDPACFFTEPHYNNYPAVLVRLDVITVPALRAILEDGWRCVTPKGAATRGARATPAVKRPAKPGAKTAQRRRRTD